YHEMWPRALVPYQRIYGVAEPRRLPWLPNDGKLSPHLPAGTPCGLVGTSSLYKRETYPGGVVPKGKVTSTYKGTGLDPFRGLGAVYGHGPESTNWISQGADAGLYDNEDIHAIRIVALEPVTAPTLTGYSRRFYGHGSNARERLRILGEF